MALMGKGGLGGFGMWQNALKIPMFQHVSTSHQAQPVFWPMGKWEVEFSLKFIIVQQLQLQGSTDLSQRAFACDMS